MLTGPPLKPPEQGVSFPTFQAAAIDPRAEAEAAAMAGDVDIEKDGKSREHGRDQSFKDHVNRATIVLFWFICLLLLLGLGSYTWHLLMPAKWHYLEKDQLDQIRTIVSAAVLSSALTGYASKRMT